MRKFVKPVGTRPGIMHGNCKVHKQEIDGCPPFRPILSALQTPTYNLAKFLVPLLNPLTKNEYTVKDSFQFAEEICEQDPTLSMGSLDVDSLFTNIPLDETIDICVNQLFENTDTTEGFTKSELKQLITVVKPSNNSAICDHLLHCNFLPSFDNFSVLAQENKKYLLEIKESLLIMRDKPSLNRNINSASLYLFDKVS